LPPPAEGFFFSKKKRFLCFSNGLSVQPLRPAEDASMKRFAAIVLSAVLLGVWPALAQTPTVLEFVDGNDLSSLNNQNQFAAQSYIIGVVDAALAAGSIAIGARGSGAKTCLPVHATQAQVYGVVMQYIANQPDSLQYPAAGVVGMALYQAYPCAP